MMEEYRYGTSIVLTDPEWSGDDVTYLCVGDDGVFLAVTEGQQDKKDYLFLRKGTRICFEGKKEDRHSEIELKRLKNVKMLIR